MEKRTSNSLSPFEGKSMTRLDDNFNLHLLFSFLRYTFLATFLALKFFFCRHPERFPDESSKDNSNHWGQRHPWLFSSRGSPKACSQVNPHCPKVFYHLCHQVDQRWPVPGPDLCEQVPDRGEGQPGDLGDPEGRRRVVHLQRQEPGWHQRDNSHRDQNHRWG